MRVGSSRSDRREEAGAWREVLTPLAAVPLPLASSRLSSTLDRLHVFAADGVVLRLRMVDDDRRRALLGDELKGARQLHAELGFGGKQLEDHPVILEIGTGAV